MITSKPQMSFANTFPFVRTLLSAALLSVVVVPAYALEALTDASMSDATGEGLAFFTNNFQFQMPSVAGDVSQAAPAYGNNYGAGNATFGGTVPGNYGAYVYVSPLGSVPAPYALLNGAVVAVGTSGATTITPNRTDVFLYGLSLSENNITAVTTAAGTACTQTVFNSSGQATTAGVGCIAKGSVVSPANGLSGTVAHNTLFNSSTSTGGINWGSATNPFLLSVNTTNTASAPVGYTSLPGLGGGVPGTSPQVPFLQLAAPTAALASSDPSNNLRLGMWMNILQENMTGETLGTGGNAGTASAPSGATGNNSLTASGTAGPALQLQAIWDGFGINGTVINAFPTDPCTSSGDTCANNPSGTANQGNSAYSKTLGFAGVLRFNTQPTGVLRLSVGGSGTTTSNYGVFDPYEGLYLQQIDINLPLGNVNYQPLILSSGAVAFGATGVSPTISLELAQIPNIASVYNQFYINYDPNCTVSGITCTSSTGNAYGNPSGAVGLTPAAGMCSSGFGSITACPATATHGNISIGNVYVNTSGAIQTMSASYTPTSGPNSGVAQTITDTIYPGEADANFLSTSTTSSPVLATAGNTTGVSFKAPDGAGGSTGAAINLGNSAISGLMINHMKMTLTGL